MSEAAPQSHRSPALDFRAPNHYEVVISYNFQVAVVCYRYSSMHAPGIDLVGWPAHYAHGRRYCVQAKNKLSTLNRSRASMKGKLASAFSVMREDRRNTVPDQGRSK